jgi:hypothetical protein
MACGGTASRPAPNVASPAAPADDDATLGLLEHHRHHHHGGVTLLIAMSLDMLGVPPDRQAAVERIRSELHARMEPARAAEQSLTTVLADGVSEGAVDPAKVDAAVTQLASAAAAAYDASIDALDQLHAALTPVERSALADKVEAHGSVWQQANADESGRQDGQVAELTKDLALAPDQVDKILASLAAGARSVPPFDPQEVTSLVHAFGDAFRGDAFDARALATAHDANAHMVSWGAGHEARFLEAVAPVLTMDQRATLAQMLREHAGHDPSASAPSAQGG